MKLVIVLALVAFAAARPGGRYDNFNVDEVIQNSRLFDAYVQCFLDKGRCTSEGADLKKLIPDAVKSSCGKCSEKEKHLIAKVMKACMDKHPADWDEMNKLHNPDGKYDVALKEFIATYYTA